MKAVIFSEFLPESKYDFEMVEDPCLIKKITSEDFESEETKIMFNSKFYRLSGTKYFFTKYEFNKIEFYLGFSMVMCEKYSKSMNEIFNNKPCNINVIDFYNFVEKLKRAKD